MLLGISIHVVPPSILPNNVSPFDKSSFSFNVIICWESFIIAFVELILVSFDTSILLLIILFFVFKDSLGVTALSEALVFLSLPLASLSKIASVSFSLSITSSVITSATYSSKIGSSTLSAPAAASIFSPTNKISEPSTFRIETSESFSLSSIIVSKPLSLSFFSKN